MKIPIPLCGFFLIQLCHAASTIKSNSKCPGPNGFWPIEEGVCSKDYYSCISGSPYVLSCPTGSLFDPVLLICVNATLGSCGNNSSIRVTQEPFGIISSTNQSVTRYTLTNKSGAKVELISYGASVAGLWVPDKYGKLVDVVLGFDDLDGYLGIQARNPYFGAIVGRVANRIAKAKFTLDGITYQLAANNGENSLHGGVFGFGKVVWQAHVHKDGRLTFSLSSPHLDEGFPGHLMAQVTYTFTSTNELIIDFKAVTDRPTPVNFANHAYFNLDGHDAGAKELYTHRVQLNADHYTPVDESLIPTGEIAPVEGTIFDLRKETMLGDVILKVPGTGSIVGYDHNFVAVNNHETELFNQTIPLVARLHHPASGRLLRVYSDQPGFQLYTGNSLPTDGSLVGKAGTVYSAHGGLCVETQNFPNAVNQPNFPDSILLPGSVYQRTAVYQFSILG